MQSLGSKMRLTKSTRDSIIDTRGIKVTYGFTIIELLLATTVFSLVMLGALVGFLQTGRLFYKGVSVTQTQATAKQILDDITGSLSNTTTSRVIKSPSGSYSYYCLGNVRYTYNLSPVNPLDVSAAHNWSPGGNYGLLRDTVNGCAAPCVTGVNCSSSTVAFNNAVEILSDRMRLSAFSINSAGGNLFTINITLAYGDNGSLSSSTPPTCVGNSQNQQFCAVSNLLTSASTGF